MARAKDLTHGSPAKLILLFALPLMAANVFEELYTMVDTAVVGKGLGVRALAAVGTTDWINWLMFSTVMGFMQGFSLQCAQDFGAGDLLKLRRTIAHAIRLALIIGIVLTVFSESMVYPTLRLLGTPSDIIAEAALYMRIRYAAILIAAAYNLAAAILRALGNSRTPLLAMLSACIINIILDLVFVLQLGWGIAGAAAATVASQTVSFLICFLGLSRMPEVRLSREDFRREKGLSSHLMKLALPMAFQNVTISVGGLAVQAVVNSFGTLFVAGYTTTSKMYGLLEIAATSFGFAIASFTGQNLGARNPRRIHHGVHSGVWMALLTSSALAGLIWLFSTPLIMLFISGSPDEVRTVFAYAQKYLMIMCLFLPVLYMLYVYRSALQGMGNTIIPMLSGVLELIMRVGSALLLPGIIGETGLFVAEVAAWSGAAIFLSISYYVEIGRLRRSIALEEAAV
ncbi:MAG: MATE family efflux transporter [Firmicutes bacterium]|nr:MATE family efflux transporter [Bacillota bacterium]